MVTRAIRQRDLLDRLDVRHGVDGDDGVDRPLRKAELERLHVELGLSKRPMGTVPGLRRDIREEVLDTDHKSAASQFSRSELRRLHRALQDQQFLSAADVLPVLGGIPDPGSPLVVNGDEYTVTDTTVEEDATSDAYDGYVLIHLGPATRLALFHKGWDGDLCTYRTSAALEEQRRDPPYREWWKAAYVESLEVRE